MILNCSSRINNGYVYNQINNTVVDVVVEELETNMNEKFLHEPDGDIHIYYNKGSLEAGVLGQAEKDGNHCNVTLSILLTSYNIRKHVVLHELGHCFGMGHSNNPNDIMYAYYLPQQESQESYINFMKQLNEARQ